MRHMVTVFTACLCIVAKCLSQHFEKVQLRKKETQGNELILRTGINGNTENKE